MANLDELLNTVSAEEETYTKVDGYEWTEYSDDYGPVLITNRSIADLTDEISVRGDRRSQYICFQTERYQDGIDLTERKICIHYERDDIELNGDNNVAVNVEASSSYIRFGWIIPAAATAYEGTIRIMPYAYLVDGDDMPYLLKELYAEYTIHEGLELSGGIAKPGTDWYEQFMIACEKQVAAAQAAAKEAAANAGSWQTSEANAKASATAAANSATAAKTSETNAKSSATSAASSAATAKKYAESIEGDVDAANEAAASAAQSATDAQEAAETAQEFANTIQIVSEGVFVTSFTIKKSGWVSSGDTEYPYQNDVTVTGINSKFYSSVSIDKDDLQAAANADMSPTTETRTNKIRFWAKTVPTKDIDADAAFFYANGSAGGALSSIPTATKTRLGVVKIGNNINVETDGLIYVDSDDVVEETLTTDAETTEMLNEIF